MKTRLATLAFAALLGALAGASGCVDNRASIETQRICFPTEDCTFSATCDLQYIGTPALDRGKSGDDTLWLFIQMANQLPNNADLGTGRTNTNDAHVDEAYIEYEGAMSGTQLVGSNYLVPASGNAVISVKFALATAAAGEVVAHVRFRGYYDNGSRFETGDFPITIKVCGSGTTAGNCAPTAAEYGCDLTKTVCPAGGQLPLNCTLL